MGGVPHVLVLLVAYALLTSSTFVDAQNPPAERPIYTLGERWIRSDGVWQLRLTQDLEEGGK